MRQFHFLALTAAVLLSGCATDHYWDPTTRVGAGKGHVTGRIEDTARKGEPAALETTLMEGEEPKEQLPPKRQHFGGTGVFVKGTDAGPGIPAAAEGDITLNFDNTDLREVVKVILGDLLGLNYALDPGVQGAVTMETGKPLSRDMLLPTLETLLRMNKAALVDQGGMYRVMPVSAALQGTLVPQLGDSRRPLPRGYSVRIVPLTFIGVEEMAKILTPIAPQGSIIRTDNVRNLMILAGTSPEMGSLLETIEVFDVDWIKGLSVGVFRLEYGNIADVSQQLNNLLTAGGGDNPLAGLFRIIPVESTNSLMVITHNARYLDEVEKWIGRLDQAGSEGDGTRLFVYRVKHGDAETLASLISDLFSEGSSRKAARVAPGRTAAKISSPAKKTTPDGRTASNKSPSQNRDGRGATGGTSSVSLESGVKIVADAVNNSLIVRATPTQYRMISEALEQLDILPLQVLVEATIVEVTLNGELQYGLQWFFKTNHGDKTGLFEFDGNLDGDSSGLGKLFPGFNWSFVKGADDVRAVLSAFAGDGLINVLSSPSVMVLDNHTAKIQVGDQVPVATTQQQGTSTEDRVVNSIEFRDTGVLLSVTPRVTPGGLVIMDVEQEVSDAVATTVSSLDSPTIQTRNISSSVAVKNDQAVVLGGLIRDRSENTDGGIPGLYNLPGVGWMFGQKSKNARRTELVVILTPQVISNDTDIEKVTEHFRSKLQGLREKF